MSRLIFFFLTFITVYLCVDVVKGAVEENDLPPFVRGRHSRHQLLENLKASCKRHHGTRVIADLQLGKCEMTCATGTWGLFSSSLVKLTMKEPCDNAGGRCYPPGVCAHES
uniref:Putative ixodes 8-cys protein n=1 Tax=Ixodes ricinus TaxID=34613 RepID=A0A0K8RIN7_IXORI